LVKCPKCGTTVASPIKTWSMPKKPAKPGGESKLTMGMFECPRCKARFRTTIETLAEAVSIKSMVEKIRGIKGEFMQTLKTLHEKIKTLESERANLMVEIEELKKMAESKVTALESEVSMLRDEVKSLKELLGYSETETK